MQPQDNLVHLMSNEHHHHHHTLVPPSTSPTPAGVAVPSPVVDHHFSLSTKNHPFMPSTTTTTKVLFDYLLHTSIQSRLEQAKLELKEMQVHPTTPTQPLEARRRSWAEAASEAEKDKRAVEAILPGILSVGSKVNTPSFVVDYESRQRLHLCQLSNIVFGRFDRPTKITTTHHAHTHHRAIASCFCRRHRRQGCDTCDDRNSNKCANGLVEAIPIFLRVSADLLRRTLDTASDARPMVFAGQRVMGGGMPPRWYDLFLELLTQAAIERYLCDGQVGQEAIFGIFSYGEVEDEDEPDETDDDEDQDYHEDENDLGEDYWGVRAADHHLLFPKTRTMYLFKTQVLKREKELLMANEQDIQTHFMQLIRYHPLEPFERNLTEFIQLILSTIYHPEHYERFSLPSVYKYPEDGSLLMPEVSDDDVPDLIDGLGLKRRASSLSLNDEDSIEQSPKKRSI